MNILYISYDGMTDPLGQSQVLPYLTELSKKGYSIDLISCEKSARFENRKKEIHEICNAAKINWHPLRYTKNPPVFSTLKDVRTIRKKAFQIHREKEIHLTHCRSYIAALVGVKMKKKFQIPFLFDMRGFWADERVDAGLWKLKNPVFKQIYHFFKRKEKEFLLHADAVVSLTEAGIKEMQQWENGQQIAEKTTVIPCAADFNHFLPRTPTQKQHGKNKIKVEKNQFVLSYMGSIGTWYMLDEMIQFFAFLKEKRKDAVFLLLTPEAPEIIFQKGEEYGLKKDDFRIYYVAREELPSYVYASDLSLFFIENYYSKTASSPTKMGELMAMEIPILCNAGVGDVEKIVEESGWGKCLKDVSKHSLQKAATSVDKIPSHNKEKMRTVAKKYYDLNQGVEKYASIYKRIR